MRQHRHFDIRTLPGLQEINLQIGSENPPIKIEKRERSDYDDQRRPLSQLPARAFQLPSCQRDHGESRAQPRADSAGDKKRQRRGRDGRIGRKSEVGVEPH